MVNLLTTALTFAAPTLAAFGYTSSGNNFLIDAGSANPLLFQVSKSNCDINSIRYRGIELQDPAKGTHLISGFGSASVSATQGTSSAGRFVKVTCQSGGITQYYIVREGDSTIFAATHTTSHPDIGELRFIARLKSSVLPYEHPFGAVSTTSGSSSTVEGSDVFIVNGQTRSKFYSSERFIDENVHCVWGDTVDVIHACILIANHETSSHGPFFRDINSNNAGSATNLYNYMNSGHLPTEPFRLGLHGPYAMTFSRSGIPQLRDFSDTTWFGDLGLQGYVPYSDRGRVSGTASGIGGNFQRVVHWYNNAAQYWTYADSSGRFTSPYMKPGTYTMKLYQTEFLVATTSSVTVSRGQTTTQNIASQDRSRTTLWKIGEFDGQPFELKNGDKFLRMHPSDSRMSSWSSQTFTIGQNSARDFPMALFKSVNNGQTIKFNLNSVPSGQATLRIATTLSFAGARPNIVMNGWTSAIPAAPPKIDSRGVTRGGYRGYGEVYDINIPSGNLKNGENTVVINLASGSSGDMFLSPNFIFDAVELFTS